MKLGSRSTTVPKLSSNRQTYWKMRIKSRRRLSCSPAVKHSPEDGKERISGGCHVGRRSTHRNKGAAAISCGYHFMRSIHSPEDGNERAGAVEPAAPPDQLLNVRQLGLLRVVTPPGSVVPLSRHQLLPDALHTGR